MSPQFWLNFQTRFDLEVTENLLAERLEKKVQLFNSNRIFCIKPRNFRQHPSKPLGLANPTGDPYF
jgi:hypothetical protein